MWSILAQQCIKLNLINNLAAFFPTLTWQVLLTGGSPDSKVSEISKKISVDSRGLQTQKESFTVPFLSPHGTPCPSILLISWFWQLLTDQIPSAGKKQPMPGVWSPSKLTLHLLILLVLHLPASASPCTQRSKHTQNVAAGTFCPYLRTARLRESGESRNRTRKAIWIRGLSFALWRCILFFACLFSFPDPFLEACHTRCCLLLAARQQPVWG